MILFKKCPRCQGDAYLEDNGDNSDIVCLQCGWRAFTTLAFPYIDRRSEPATAALAER